MIVQRCLFAVIATVAVALSGAEAADSLSTQAQLCRTIPDPTTRLQCFDRAVDSSRVQPLGAFAPPPVAAAPPRMAPVAPAPQAAAPTYAPAPVAAAPRVPAVTTPAAPVARAPVVAAAPVQQRAPAPAAAPEDDGPCFFNCGPAEPALTVSAVEADRNERLIITLDNGQVWRSQRGMSLRYKFQPGQPVSITRRFLGSHVMRLDNRRSFDVERVS